MSNARRRTLRPSLAALLVGFSVLAPRAAIAAPFQLIYTGAFDARTALNLASASGPTYFSAATPFTVRALFDNSSPNLAPTFGGPFNGFRAYAPTSAIIDVAGMQFSIDSYFVNPLTGITVAIFDQNSFVPGRYGIGLIADPVGDGAGFVGDFVSASPGFTVAALTPTVFTNYAGVGYGSGACLSGAPPACPRAVTPWVLRDSNGVAWNLSFGNYEEDYPAGPLNTAQLVSVPEPSLVGLMLASVATWATTRRRRTMAADGPHRPSR